MKRALAEFLGTAFFIYCILVSRGNPIVIGIALTVAVYVTSILFGAAGDVNPAVTIVMQQLGKISKREMYYYIIAQVLGGLLAIYLYKNMKLRM